MEAVTAIIKNLLKNTRIVLVLGVVLGLILGLILGWGIWPVQWINAEPVDLRPDLQADYLRMTIDSLNRTGDANKAMERWSGLKEAQGDAFAAVTAAPEYLNPADIQKFAQLVQQVTNAPVPPPGAAQQDASGGTPWLIYGAGAVILIVLLAGGLYLYRLLRKNSGPATAVMQAAEVSRNAERTNFEEMGLAPPITQTMTTYVLGDDLYDESFSIDTGGGEFLGEYGVGVSETVGVGEPKKVAALEIWLFDKNDIKTATKVLMSEYAYNDPGIRARLEPKGELIVVKPQEQVLLETETLQLLATVVDMEYGMGAMPQKSHFDRITLELAIWPRAGK